MPPPPRPLLVNEVIPKTIEALQRRHERIVRLVEGGGYIDGGPDLDVLDLCKQILAADQT